MFDDILPLVRKPIRYTGGEYNVIAKTDPRVNVALVYPEVYEIGMSNLGLRIIYYLFNQVHGLHCDRIFAPWSDFGEHLKNRGLSLYGLETKRPMQDFDLLGFSLQTELSYTTVLYMLDIAHIPFRSAERDARHPLLIAGGPAVLNPAPLSRVFDAFVIGDGEDAVEEIARILINIPQQEKIKRLVALSKVDGVWVPEIHGHDTTIKRSRVAHLDEHTIPTPPLVPICGITHDRLSVEVMRGCAWGCRFCQAGYSNRPVRIRPNEDVIRAVEQGIRQSGWEEISLLSFSILDYPDLLNVIRKLNEILKKKMVNISLPAMRGELFSAELALLLKEIKKTGLTFAPETASEGLRCRLNKQFSNDRLISSIETAHTLGWRRVKLYFMVGLPFETHEDIEELKRLIQKIGGLNTHGSIKVSVSPFVPKPHTAFESVPFAQLDELHEKMSAIASMKRRRVEIKYQAPETAFVEAVLSRADERILPVIEHVYHHGGIFEEWREGFDFSRWQSACQAQGIDPMEYLTPHKQYPWDFIDTGVTKDFLNREYVRAQNAVITENCYYGTCAQCGACNGKQEKHSEKSETYMTFGRYPKRRAKPIMYRVKYAIGEPFRYASHLDIARTIYRALRRTDLPLQFTQGFSPIPRVSFCPPKSVGQIARGDYFDFYLDAEYFGNLSLELNTHFPPGIRILEVRALPADTPSLSSSINVIYYDVELAPEVISKPLDVARTPASIETKTGRKNLADDVESAVFSDTTLTCGLYFGERRVTIYEFLSYVADVSVESAKTFKVTRTKMFIKKNDVLYSPMEAM